MICSVCSEEVPSLRNDSMGRNICNNCYALVWEEEVLIDAHRIIKYKCQQPEPKGHDCGCCMDLIEL